MSCKQCISESRVNHKINRLHLQNPSQQITAPEGAIQLDLVPELPPSVGYGIIVAATDVLSRCFFAYPTSNKHSKTNAKVIINIIIKHTYLPTTKISDKGSAFMSHVNNGVAAFLALLCSTPQHSTRKQLGCLNDHTLQSNNY